MLQTGVTGAWADVAPELDERFGATFRYLARIFRSRGFTTEEADDLAQEAVVRTLSHLRRHGRRAENITPLLHTIAKNLVVERFRTGGREVAVALDERIPDAGRTPEARAIDVDRARLIHEAIASLPEKQRRAVLLWLEGLTPPQIAENLGIKRNAVDALLHRARRYLATRLEDVRDTAWGAGALLWGRMRRACFRVTAWSYGFDPLPVATAVVVVATAALLSIGGSSVVGTASGPRSVAASRTVPLVRSIGTSTSRSATDTSAPATREQRTSVAPERPVQVTVRYPSVRVAAPNPNKGKEPVVWVDLSEDPSHRGPIETKLQNITGAACDRAPSACGGD